MTHVNSSEFMNSKCINCNKSYEVRKDKWGTAYARYCPLCFDKWVTLYYDGTTEDRDEAYINNKDYKDELQEVTHRGKHQNL